MKMFTIIYTDLSGTQHTWYHNAEDQGAVVDMFKKEMEGVWDSIDFVIEHEADSELERDIHNHGVNLDELQEPDVWREGYKWIDRGPGRAKSLVTYQVRNISVDDIEVRLLDQSTTLYGVANEWGVEEFMLNGLVEESSIERCNTCDYWSHESEMTEVDGELKCADCLEEEEP